jgi:peptide deformylase
MTRMVQIIDRKNPILRHKTKEVPYEMIKTPEIQELIANMQTTLNGTPDGVGLAAPQVAASWRIFIVKTNEYSGVFINPEVIKISDSKFVGEEGCLSVRGVYGFINRAKSIKLKAYNEHGKLFKERAKGFLARVFQHELDHLDGVLFIDKAEKIHSADGRS